MRLHRLSITAFGPFVETAEVDFDALADAGLFLLSGATGAGKSSVLDAVCFGLYGAIPGDRNHAGRLRSDQAPPDLAPRVELDATLSDRRFLIVRSPAWDRPKRRGTGLTREPAKVTVSERVGGDWVPLSNRLDEAGDLVSGLLGMNLDQFCQVALLPQGHFQAFLRADSAQRHHLLARLFRTGRFERVEDWLRNHRLALRRDSQTHLAAVSDLVSRLSEAAAVDANRSLSDLPAAAGDGSLRAWAGWLRRTTETDQATAQARAETALTEARTATSAWETARAEALARSRVHDAARTQRRLLDAAAAHALDVQRLEAGRRADGLRPLAGLAGRRSVEVADARSDADAALTAASDHGLDVADLPATLARLGHELSALTLLLPAEQRLTDLRGRHDAVTKTLQALRRDAELAGAERSTLAGLTGLLERDVQVAASAEQSLPEVEATAARVHLVAEAHADVARWQSELALATADHSAATARLLDAREHFLDVRERRIAGMAAELAGALAVGDDCPVCGSADHPHPARASATQSDAAAERVAQRAVDDVQSLEHALALRVRETTSSLETAQEVAAAIPAADLDATLATAERGLDEVRAAASRRPALATQLAEARHRDAVLDDEGTARRVRTAELSTTQEHLSAQRAELEERVTAARGDHGALSEALAQCKTRRAIAQRAHDSLAAGAAAERAHEESRLALERAALEAGFEGVHAARAAELPTDQLDSLDDAVRRHRVALESTEEVLAEPGARQLLDASAPDVETLEAAHRAAGRALEQARAADQLVTRRRERVAGLADELRVALDAWTPVREQLELATEVSAFAEGKAPDNRLQMRLSAYVLAFRLTQVVAAANARLAGMSDQRYSLEHVGRRGAGESRGGLSLVVRDDWSGESRDPATLSGGETFVVSLALALGLADVVAHEAGGADLATLFVDEGFGSLDAETLDDVLDILDTLRENGRAVGVVSHVAEMRDRIPTQLVVTKARAGSTVRICT